MDALTPTGQLFGLAPWTPLDPGGSPWLLCWVFRPFCLQPSARRPGVARLPADLRPPRQASPLGRRLARPRRPNRVHDGSRLGEPALRTGRSRFVALHLALLRRSYASIPHDSSPQGSGLSPLRPSTISGARPRTVPVRSSTA